MRLEYDISNRLQKEILEIIGSHVDLRSHKVFFFGSRVSGRSSEQSDIDVGIEGSSPLPRVTLRAIREALEELPTLYSIDVVDFATVTDEFRQVALEHVEPIGATSV